MNTIQRTRNAVSAFRQPTQAFRVLALCAFLALGSLCGSVQAAVPQTISYQGNLTNLGGTPISSAVVMTFRLYNVASGGAALWTETQLSVNVANGIFNAVLGSVTSLTLPFDVPYWLTVAINSDGEMSPRQPLTASPYALRAATADTISGGLTPLSFTQPTLQNGWAGSLTSVPGFGKDAAGFVHLRGLIQSGTLGTSAFQLPAGLRPAQAALFSALHVFGGNSTACGVTINASGDVIIGALATDTGCTGTAGIYSLDGITFRAG